ncbi:PH domain-containing protein [Lentzea sp. JNUCC 0626]|uniref:PH domain-containing protein n=1 Tax=Lentzea sp. JNUCC 0626 TaxID=3367513 RepID=UPI003748137B
MGENVTFVRRGPRRFVAAVLVLGMVVVPWRLTVNFGDSTLVAMGGTLYVLAALVGIWQLWRVCVVLTPEKVIVRNPWRDHHITWDRIAEIERENVLGMQRVNLVLTDGSSVPCAAYRGGSLTGTPLGEDFVGAVRQRIAHLRESNG